MGMTFTPNACGNDTDNGVSPQGVQDFKETSRRKTENGFTYGGSR